MKKLLAVILALMLTLGACAETINVAALNGPTGMGLVKLMKAEEGGDAYTFTLAASADLVTPKLIKGELDIACVPANLASVLYNNTSGALEVLAINTLGVLYIVESGDTVNTIEDLKGRTIYASGKGSTPEYALDWLLTMHGIDPDKDVNIVFKSEHAECLTMLLSEEDAVALLPQPFVTVAQTKSDKIRIAIDLNSEWDALETGSGLITGVVVARKAFVQDNSEAVNAFLEAYARSVEYVNTEITAAAALIGEYGIVAEAVAQCAIPYCNIVCITGEEMRTKLGGYLEVLYNQNPASVGGKLPEEDFYFVN